MNKRIKQIFSNEIKYKVKNKGEYAFIIDNNDFVVKINKDIYVRIKEDPVLHNELKNIQINYLNELSNFLESLVEPEEPEEPTNNGEE